MGQNFNQTYVNREKSLTFRISQPKVEIKKTKTTFFIPSSLKKLLGVFLYEGKLLYFSFF